MMRRPYNPKTDPVSWLLIGTLIGGPLVASIVFGTLDLRKIRARLESLHGGRTVQIVSVRDDSRRDNCGTYVLPPNTKAWRYLDNDDLTWAEDQFPATKLPSSTAALLKYCATYEDNSRYGGIVILLNPLMTALANRGVSAASIGRTEP